MCDGSVESAKRKIEWPREQYYSQSSPHLLLSIRTIPCNIIYSQCERRSNHLFHLCFCFLWMARKCVCWLDVTWILCQLLQCWAPPPPSCKKPPSSYFARREHGQSYQTGNISCSIMCKSLHGMPNLDFVRLAAAFVVHGCQYNCPPRCHKPATKRLTKPTSWKTFCSNIFAIISSSTAPSDSQII